jgi:hypothetical protein
MRRGTLMNRKEPMNRKGMAADEKWAAGERTKTM